MLQSPSGQWLEYDRGRPVPWETYPGLACLAQQPAVSEWPSVTQAPHLGTDEQAVGTGGGGK